MANPFRLFLAAALSTALIASAAAAGFDRDAAKKSCEAEWGMIFEWSYIA